VFTEPIPLRLHIVRHGETDYNAKNIVQGAGIDSSLNATGRFQADRFYNHHRFTHFEQHIFCSKLQRTAQTLEPFLEDGYKMYRVEGIHEFHYGKYEGKEFTNAVKEELAPTFQAWESGDLELPIPGGGDSPASALQRATLGIQQILSVHPTGNLLICTHGRLMRILLSHLIHADITKMNDFRHQNTGLNILNRTISGFTAEILNDTSHLP
jgi:phosphoserine phosphatase